MKVILQCRFDPPHNPKKKITAVDGTKFLDTKPIVRSTWSDSIVGKEVAVDEPSKDTTTTVLKFFSCHKKYQRYEPLKELGIPSITVEEFWEDGDKVHNEFEYGKPLVIKQVHATLMWPLRRFHEWYYLICVCVLQFIKGHIQVEFKSRSLDINIKMFELHTIYRLRMLDITMMTVMCTLVYTCDEEKRLGFLNPTQINQLELNSAINEKSEMFKGMSKKKRATTVKKHNKHRPKRKEILHQPT
jgi:hypothetical protein